MVVEKNTLGLAPVPLYAAARFLPKLDLLWLLLSVGPGSPDLNSYFSMIFSWNTIKANARN